MQARYDLLRHLPELRLTRLRDERPAGLWVTSLPWPRSSSQSLALGSQSTFVQPVGQWPGEPEGTPRRLLLMADGGNNAPAALSVVEAGTGATFSPGSFDAEMVLFERSPHPEFVWERHFLRLWHGDNWVGIALGLRTLGEVHWWEACRLVEMERSDTCLVIEMGGAIPCIHMDWVEFNSYPGLTNPLLHKHNWINGRLYVRLHANGVCEVFAHHINSKFFDDGVLLEDVIPVIGFRCEAAPESTSHLSGEWDGRRDSLELGAVHFDLSEAARLATPEQPGRISQEGDFFTWQPYQGVELYGGSGPESLTGDPFIFHAEQHVMPRGMARTLRFSLSLSERSPRVARYLAPAWWYGACEEFLPEPLLPVFNDYDDRLKKACAWIECHTVQGGFEDGSVARTASLDGTTRDEPGWEGEMPYAQFLSAWRTGDAEEYFSALRSAYYFTDVVVDHAAQAVRMHGYKPHAFSLPMNRMQGTIAAYLETADPYLLETAQAVTANSYWTHKNSWPRMTVGRDACFIRSAVLLYRYFEDESFRKMAYEAALDTAHSQRPNGSFGDQGGGSGVHQWTGYMTKPWVCLLAVGGILDYLELFPDEPVLLECVRKLADWLMAERFDHNGITSWSFQHDFDGKRCSYNPILGMVKLPGPELWHHDTLGRLLTLCALRFAEPAYLDAWAESFQGEYRLNDHCVAAALQFIPWVQAKLWNARLGNEGLTVNPMHFGPRMPDEGCIATPWGEIEYSWRELSKPTT